MIFLYYYYNVFRVTVPGEGINDLRGVNYGKDNSFI